MPVLVGADTTTGWQTLTGNGTLYYTPFTSAASGTAAAAYIRLYGGDGVNLKICLYSHAGALIATSAVIAGASNSIVSGAISATIDASTGYFLGVIFDADELAPNHDGTEWNTSTNASGSYASPPATVAHFDDGGGGNLAGHMAIWLESASAPQMPAYGYATPDTGETATSWTTWHLGDGASISGDPDYGDLVIPLGITCSGPVIDSGNTDAKGFTVTCPKYDSNAGSVTIEYRGSASSFAWDAGSPSWSTYTTTVSESWQYFQVRLTGA